MKHLLLLKWLAGWLSFKSRINNWNNLKREVSVWIEQGKHDSYVLRLTAVVHYLFLSINSHLHLKIYILFRQFKYFFVPFPFMLIAIALIWAQYHDRMSSSFRLHVFATFNDSDASHNHLLSFTSRRNKNYFLNYKYNLFIELKHCWKIHTEIKLKSAILRHILTNVISSR